jgi:metal transporter CNNM
MDIFAEIAKTASRKHGEPIPDWEYWVIVGIIITLVLLGGIVAGLTIGLMSIDTTNLSILKASGTAQEKKYAARIEPIRKNTHLLLVTLLLVNTVVNETLPILFDAIHYTGWKAVLSSTVLIVVFGEILPQAICSRHGLRIGAFFAWPVRILIWFMWLISYPIAKLLDWLLGHKGGIVYRHAGLKELVTLHGEDQSGPLSSDEVSILRAVLDLRTKTVKDVMTSLEDVYMLEVSKKLDRKTVASVLFVN